MDKIIIEMAKFMLENNYTVREAAKHLNISKTRLHDCMHKKLKYIDMDLFDEVQLMFNKHYDTKHIKGGNATRLKYLKN